jgi:S1-C subfamily serine protease
MPSLITPLTRPRSASRGARIATGLFALIALVAACTAPVRFANPTSNKPATSSSASPGQAAPSITTASPGVTTPIGSGALVQMQDEIRKIIAQVNPSVVQIDTATGLGSGIVMDTNGDIVTNAHVVGADKTFTVTTFDGHSLPATLVGTYPGNDLAVIKVGSDTSLRPAVFADSSTVQVGDIVLAIGSPLGLTDSVSEGIVAALGRSQSEGGGVTLNNLIQVTAPINPGNSGGALVNISGQVIGIPTLASASGRGGGATNIAFAISSNQVVTVTKQLATGGIVTHTNQPYMGVSVTTGPNGEAVVGSVVAGGPADKAGVQSGWIIERIGGQSVASPAGVTQTLAKYKVGDKVDVVFKLPDGTTKTVNITLGERPTTP